MIFLLEFAKLHQFEKLEQRAVGFVTSAYGGMRAKQSRAELEAALGSELFSCLELEQTKLDAKVGMNKQVGSVIEGPAVGGVGVGDAAPWRGEWHVKVNRADLGGGGSASASGGGGGGDASSSASASGESSSTPNIDWPTDRLRTWLTTNCVAFGAARDHAALAELAAKTHEEIAAEERAMAEYDQAAAKREPAVVTAYGAGSGRRQSVLDEAREGEEIARAELLEEARMTPTPGLPALGNMAAIGLPDVGRATIGLPEPRLSPPPEAPLPSAPLVEEGALVEAGAVVEGAVVVAPLEEAAPRTLLQMVELLRHELGVQGNIKEIVEQAAVQLGVPEGTSGGGLNEWARRCVVSLGR